MIGFVFSFVSRYCHFDVDRDVSTAYCWSYQAIVSTGHVPLYVAPWLFVIGAFRSPLWLFMIGGCRSINPLI